jgi:hypothetical protein
MVHFVALFSPAAFLPKRDNRLVQRISYELIFYVKGEAE